MGLLRKHATGQVMLGIWEITESLEQLWEHSALSANEEVFYAGLKTPLRRKHWLAYRLILPHLIPHTLVPGISYDAYGKPSLNGGSHHISVTHSGRYAAMIISKVMHVGIDIEAMKPKIFKLSHKFLSDGEADFVDPGQMESLYLIWCAKEALFKIYGKGGLSFKDHLRVDPFVFEQKGQITGRIVNGNDHQIYRLYYETMNGYMLVYTTKAIAS